MEIDDIVCRSIGAANPHPNLSIYLKAKIEKSEALRAAGPPRWRYYTTIPGPGTPHLGGPGFGLAAGAYKERGAAGATRARTALSPSALEVA